MTYILFLLLFLIMPYEALGQVTTTTPNLGLTKPCSPGDAGCLPTGHPGWGPLVNGNFDIIDLELPKLNLDCTDGQVPTWAGGKFSICGTGSGHILEDEGTPLTSRSNLNFTGAGVSCADSGGKTVCTITGSALSVSGTGLLSQTSPGVFATRELVGQSGNISITSNPGGVGGNPVIDLGATAFQTDQSNTVTTGTQSLAAATALLVPSHAGSPTAAGSLSFNTSTLNLLFGDGTNTRIPYHAGNLPTALAANGTNATLGQFARGVDASGNAEAGSVVLSGANAPSAGTVEYPGQLYHDTRTFDCATGNGRTYVGKAVAGNFSLLANESDGVNNFQGTTGTWQPCGVAAGGTFNLVGAGNISVAVTGSFGTAGTATISTSKIAYWDAGAITPDGTQCAAPTEQTLNSGPKTWAFSCADNAASIFYGKVKLVQAVTTATFTLSLFHGTTETITFAGDFSAMCRAAGAAINNTWGTAVAADVAITTTNLVAEATSAAVTPNGTCSSGAILFWRYVVDAANFSANSANAKVLGVTMNF